MGACDQNLVLLKNHMQIRNEKLLRYADQTCLSDMFIRHVYLYFLLYKFNRESSRENEIVLRKHEK